MSIIPTKTPADPYAALAWTASVAVIALDKLALANKLTGPQKEQLDLDLQLDFEEQNSLAELSDEMALLSQASKLSARDLFVSNATPLTDELRESLTTVVAIEGDAKPPGNRPDFEKTRVNLDFIRSHIESGDTDSLHPEIIAEAHQACLELLEHLDNHRHTFAPH